MPQLRSCPEIPTLGRFIITNILMNKSKIKIYLRIEDGGWGRIDKKRPEAWIIDDIIKTHLIMKNIEIIYK